MGSLKFDGPYRNLLSAVDKALKNLSLGQLRLKEENGELLNNYGANNGAQRKLFEEKIKTPTARLGGENALSTGLYEVEKGAADSEKKAYLNALRQKNALGKALSGVNRGRAKAEQRVASGELSSNYSAYRNKAFSATKIEKLRHRAAERKKKADESVVVITPSFEELRAFAEKRKASGEPLYETISQMAQFMDGDVYSAIALYAQGTGLPLPAVDRAYWDENPSADRSKRNADKAAYTDLSPFIEDY